MRSFLLSSTLVLVAVISGATGDDRRDPNTAQYAGCLHARGEPSTEEQDGFFPGLYVTTSNIPGATYNKDGSLANRKVVCAHQDQRTTGGSVVIPWAQFHSIDERGRSSYNWTFVDEQMAPWIARGQKVNLLVWPAVQKRDQLFPDGASATPDYLLTAGNTYQCPDGSAQGGTSEGIPLPMFWKRDVYRRYTRALKELVYHYQDNEHVNYFRFGIGVGAESYPANGATTPTNYCMETFIDQFDGANRDEKAMTAYNTWYYYVRGRIRRFRRFESRKPIVVTFNTFYTSNDIDPLEFPNMVAHEATRTYRSYPPLGLGVQGATTYGFDEHSPEGAQSYANWPSIFEARKHLGVPLQLQTPLHSGVNGRPGEWQEYEECQINRKNNGRYGCTNTGSMVELIEFALSVGVNSFELYPYEWMVANDRNWINKPPELNWHELYGDQYSNALTLASNQELVK